VKFKAGLTRAKSTIFLALALFILLISIYAGLLPFRYGTTTIIETKTQTSISSEVIVEPTTLTATDTTRLTESLTITSTLNGIIPPLAGVVMANISVEKYAWNVAVDPKTNMIYESGPYSDINVISGLTNRIVSKINSNSSSTQFLAVNPETNVLYAGNEIIDGNSNKVIDVLPYNVTGVAIDTSTNTVYLLSQDQTSETNSYLLIINGTSDVRIGEVSLNGSATGIAVSSITHSIYVPICTMSSGCTPSYLLSINGTDDSIKSRILLGTDSVTDTPLAIAVNPITNMVYITAKGLISINGTTNQIVAKTDLSAYLIQCRGISVNAQSNEIYVTGWGLANFGSFFIMNGANYSVLNAFVGTTEPVGVTYDENNTAIYLVDSQTDSVLALNSSVFAP
jgi:hypothetical protein